MMRALLVTVVLTTLAAGCCPRATAPRAGAADPDAPVRRVVPGEYVLRVAPGTSPAAVHGILSDLQPRQIKDLGGDRILVVFGEDPGLGRLGFRTGSGGILSVEPNTTTAPAPAPKPAR
jgi:hypothetical protein